MRLRFPFLAAFAAALVSGAFGCSSSNNPKTVKVTGKVTLDGQPLPNAQVVFIPISADGKKVEGEIKQASAKTESDGSFALGTFSTSDGAQPGDYRVTVNYSDSEGDRLAGLDDKQKNMKVFMDRDRKEAKAGKKKPPKFVVPARYTNFSQTPLKQTVPANGTVELALKGK